jgi:hypothetical protein
LTSYIPRRGPNYPARRDRPHHRAISERGCGVRAWTNKGCRVAGLVATGQAHTFLGTPQKIASLLHSLEVACARRNCRYSGLSLLVDHRTSGIYVRSNGTDTT